MALNDQQHPQKDLFSYRGNTIDKKVGCVPDCEHGNPKEPEVTRQSYEEFLEFIGIGRTQWIVLFTSGLLLMMVINETMGMSVLTIASQCDFGTNSVEKAVMSAACFIGIICSSYFFGYLSDTIGRRPILLYTTLTGNCISFISLFIPSYWVFVFLRFLTGCFIAGASSTTYAYVSEFFQLRHRPVVINYASMFVGLSMAFVPAVAFGVLGFDWFFSMFGWYVFRPWRLLIILNLLPGLIAVCMLLTLPESPKFLLSVGRMQEAVEAVNYIYRKNRGKSAVLEDIHLKDEITLDPYNILATKTSGGVLKKMWRDTRPLFKQPHALNFLLSCIIMCGLFFSSNGMGLWYTEIQNRVGANPSDDLMTVCQVIDASMIRNNTQESSTAICDNTINAKSFIDSISYGLSYVVGYIVLGVVINPLGRKLVIMGALVGSGACGISLYWIRDPVALVVVFCLYLLLPGLCISVIGGAVVDLVPTHLRGKAVCICFLLGRSGSVIGSNIIGVLLETYCKLTFGVFSGFVLICAVLTFLLPI